MASYDVRLLKSRRTKLADEAIFGTAAGLIRRGLGQGANVFGRRIAPLSTNGMSDQPPVHETAFPGVVFHTLTPQQHKRLREAANRMGAMLNDLLLAEMFQTMRCWNLDHGSSARQRLRIMMPSDMRDKDDYAMPAANMTSYNFVTRRMADCRDHLRLVKSIRDETARIKHEQRGKLFIDSIMLCNYVPGLLPWLCNANRCFATVTVSNMGDPTRRFLATFPRSNGKLVCGNIVLERMLGVSPMRPKTRASISIVTFYRQLLINVRCDPLTMTVHDAQQFLDSYVQRLTAHL
jgi:hypothetical protein